MRVLVVEDSGPLRESLRIGLTREGFAVRRVARGRDALEAPPPDLVLLDLRLPDLDGIEVCRELRSRSTVPIIVVSARGEEVDRVVGLELGADDYVVKPFGFRELLARIRAVLRRAAAPNDGHVLRAGALEIDLRARRAMLGDDELALTTKEFALLEVLMRHQGQVLTRSQLLDLVWSYDMLTESNVVDTYIHYLRNKIDRNHEGKLIRTVRGAGYSIRAANGV